MKAYNCPSCGAQVNFKSSVTLYLVCEYCRSLIVRRDLDVEALGKVAILQEDASPLMLGTQGYFHNTPFTLIGRIIRGWSDGSWNEWFMMFDDQRRGWLGEAQGQLMIFIESETNVPKATAQRWQPGELVRFANTSYSVTDVKETTCIGCEGELPESSLQGEKTVSIDLTAPPNLCATLELADDANTVYLGEFIEFEACRFANLREIPGW
jgi:DNA-directed RNA polymerase subunit RPC12/RpoP